MLEHYYVKPSTIDRIRDSWLGAQIENYVGWMEANGYSSRTVFRRLPRLFCFAEFAQKRGCTDVASAFALVEEFVSEWLAQHGAEAKTSASLRKHAIDIGNATRQMLRLASGSGVRHNRHCSPFPLESEVPGFQEYLRSECGLMESTIHGYRHHLHEFGQYLRKAGITSLGELSHLKVLLTDASSFPPLPRALRRGGKRHAVAFEYSDVMASPNQHHCRREPDDTAASWPLYRAGTTPPSIRRFAPVM